MSVLPDYSGQAERYDRTRAASPSVLDPLRAALGGTPGGTLLDVGGGTGNYAVPMRADGWDVVVVDRSAAMLARAAAKNLTAVRGDALHLPFAGGAVAAAMLVAMLHHCGDPQRALSEAMRVVRPGGRVAVMAWAREDIAESWTASYWPSSRAWMIPTHPPLADLLAWLPGATRTEVRWTDLCDGTLAALESHPELVLDPAWRLQTSFFERMHRDHPAELESGLARLAADVAAGTPPRRQGRASMLAWVKPL
ncbi:MAG TPA: class I SAM-dependent methyltransferase [Candidatus Dormibacteraeota bacterium]|nr:class I SAM-dependent methyltransferase [Candidatus Dormibacteraeota bacterium]